MWREYHFAVTIPAGQLTDLPADMAGEDKVIFGTDAINLDPKYELGKVAFSPLSDAVKKKIFAENYLKVLQYSRMGTIKF